MVAHCEKIVPQENFFSLKFCGFIILIINIANCKTAQATFVDTNYESANISCDEDQTFETSYETIPINFNEEHVFHSFFDNDAFNSTEKLPFVLKDYSMSYLSIYHLIRLEHAFYSFLTNDEMEFDKYSFKVQRQARSYIDIYEREVLDRIKQWNLVSPGKPRDYRNIIDHPFLILMLLHRCAEFASLFFHLQPANDTKKFFQVRLAESWPTGGDFLEYLTLVHHIQFVYDYDMMKFITGTFGEIRTDVSLEPTFVTKIGFRAWKAGYSASAVEWIRSAYELLLNNVNNLSSDFDYDYDPHSVAKAYEKVYLQIADMHDREWLAKARTEKLLLFHTQINRTLTRQVTNKVIAQNNLRGRRWSSPDDLINLMNSFTICGKGEGENWQSENAKRFLFCWYDRKIPIFPHKFELLHHEPFLLQIHGFITRAEKNHLLRRAMQEPQVRGETVFTENKYDSNKHGSHGSVRFRASTVAWIVEEDAVISKLEGKIEAVTGLRVKSLEGTNTYDETSEPLQVASYIPGGHFSPHSDEGDTNGYASRLATVLIYLNADFYGGNTVFTALGLNIKPESRSALFWYNDTPDGTGTSDKRLSHAGCPVILGQKWIATKWIGERRNQVCRRYFLQK